MAFLLRAVQVDRPGALAWWKVPDPGGGGRRVGFSERSRVKACTTRYDPELQAIEPVVATAIIAAPSLGLAYARLRRSELAMG